MISKKRDWKKGEYAFTLKMIDPKGGTMEFDAPHVKEAEGQALWNKLRELFGLDKKPWG